MEDEDKKKEEDTEDLEEYVEEIAEETVSLEGALAELDELIGLQSIKDQIREHIAYLDFLKLRKA